MLHNGIGLTEPVEVLERHRDIITAPGVPKHIEVAPHRVALTKDLIQGAAIIQEPPPQIHIDPAVLLEAVVEVAPEVPETYEAQGAAAPEARAMLEVPVAVAPEALEV